MKNVPMKRFVVYDADGMIRRIGYCPDGMVLLQAQAGESVLEGVADDSTQYVSGGAVVNKPPMPVSVSKTSVATGEPVTIAMPYETEANVDGDVVTVYDGTLTITFDTPGAYLVRLKRFPYRDFEVTITCY